MTTAERAAAPLLPNLPERRPDAPGQFAFADAQRVRRILEGSGWLDIDVRPVDLACTFRESELTLYMTARPARPRLARRRRTNARAPHRDGAAGVPTLRPRRRSALHGSVLAIGCPSYEGGRDLTPRSAPDDGRELSCQMPRCSGSDSGSSRNWGKRR